MKMRNKGKVHPSPSPSSINNNNNTLSVLSLLPAAILALASVLSLEDKQVLAYMVTRSMKPTTPSGTFPKKHPKKNIFPHKPPVFDCECFDCYTSYWFRWDSSPNRELIHQAIEAFEDHLSKNEGFPFKKIRNKKKVKSFGVRVDGDEELEDHLCKNEGLLSKKVRNKKVKNLQGKKDLGVSVDESEEFEDHLCKNEVKTLQEKKSLGDNVGEGEDFEDHLCKNGTLQSKKMGNNAQGKKVLVVKVEEDEDFVHVLPENADSSSENEYPVKDTAAPVVLAAASGGHKGLARKVLPDVLGLFNSRLWSLWSPNI